MVLFAPSSYVGLLLTNTLLLAFGASISSYGQTNLSLNSQHHHSSRLLIYVRRNKMLIEGFFSCSQWMVTSQTRTTTCRLEDTVIHTRDLIIISPWITLTRLAMTSTMVTPLCNLSPIPLPVGAPGTTLICENRQSPSART